MPSACAAYFIEMGHPFMIVVLKSNASAERCDMLVKWLKDQGLDVHISQGSFQTVLGLIGDTSKMDTEMLSSLDIIDSVTRISDPYKAVSRYFHPDDSVISLSENGPKIGGGNFAVFAGPHAIENFDQLKYTADSVKASGASVLASNAFLMRTSPYDFQGLGAEGLQMLSQIKKQTGMTIMSEIKDIRSLSLFEDVDVIQVGAYNTQNFDLLSELGKINKPILLKRGAAGTIKELLMSAEYITASGNENVILCERGIRTFERTYTSNTLDISAVPVLRELTHLPIVVDPCHAVGHASLVEPMALAAVAAGADGLIIEVHPDPANALSGSAFSLSSERFETLMNKVNKLLEVI